jgi:hypothetical protein
MADRKHCEQAHGPDGTVTFVRSWYPPPAGAATGRLLDDTARG